MKTIPEILNSPSGTKFEATSGKVARVYERKVGGNGQRGWSNQKAELQDSSGAKIKILVWNHPDLTPLTGLDVVLQAGQGRQGPEPLVLEHGSYIAKQGPKAGQEVKTIELVCQKTSTFQQIGQQTQKPSAASPAGTAAPQTVVTASNVESSAERLAGIGRLWQACFKEALGIKSAIEQENGEPLVSDDQFQACVSSLFIQASRDNIRF